MNPVPDATPILDLLTWTPPPSTPRPPREWLNIDTDDPDKCWVWQGPRLPKGYGRMGNTVAHRVVYEVLVGWIPKGLHLDHLCENPPCVNPAHLEPVTPAENNRRAAASRAKKRVA